MVIALKVNGKDFNKSSMDKKNKTYPYTVLNLKTVMLKPWGKSIPCIRKPNYGPHYYDTLELEIVPKIKINTS